MLVCIVSLNVGFLFHVYSYTMTYTRMMQKQLHGKEFTIISREFSFSFLVNTREKKVIKRFNIITYTYDPNSIHNFKPWNLSLYPPCNVFWEANFRIHISTQSFLSSFDFRPQRTKHSVSYPGYIALPPLFAVPFYRNVSHAEINWFVRLPVGVIYTR